GNGELQVIILSKEGNDARKDGFAVNAVLSSRNNTRTNFNLIAKLQHAVQDGTTSDTTLQVIDFGTGLVDVERTNDNHVRSGGKVSDGEGNALDNLLIDGANIVLELRGNGDDGAAVGHGTTDELDDELVVLHVRSLLHQIHLFLQNDDVLQLHDFNGGQMFGGLRLRARFVSGNEKQSCVHDGCSRQHSAHENVVTGAIDETVQLLAHVPQNHVP